MTQNFVIDLESESSWLNLLLYILKLESSRLKFLWCIFSRSRVDSNFCDAFLVGVKLTQFFAAQFESELSQLKFLSHRLSQELSQAVSEMSQSRSMSKTWVEHNPDG